MYIYKHKLKQKLEDRLVKTPLTALEYYNQYYSQPQHIVLYYDI